MAYHRARGEGQRLRFVSRERAYHGVNIGGTSLAGMVRNRETFGAVMPNVVTIRHTWDPAETFTRGERETGRRARRRPAAALRDLRRRDDRRGLRRAGGGVDRHAGAAEGLSAAAARDLRRARDPPRLRRGDHRVRPARRALRGRCLRRDAGRHHAGEGADQRRDPDGGGRGRPTGCTPRSPTRRPRRRSSSSTATPTPAHPAACAAGLATLQIYEDEGLFERAAGLSDYFLDAVWSLRDLPVVRDIRGLGLLAGVEVHPRARPARGARDRAAEAAVLERMPREVDR